MGSEIEAWRIGLGCVLNLNPAMWDAIAPYYREKKLPIVIYGLMPQLHRVRVHLLARQQAEA